MWIRKFDLEQFDTTGNCRWQLLFPWQDVVQTPFWSGWTHLRPGESTRKHQHHEIEVYLIAQGHGEMQVDGEIFAVGPGDVLYIPPFNHHVLENRSSEDILFLSIFWENLNALSRLPAEEASHDEKAVIMAAPPPDRRPDLAALCGTWLATDVHLRYRRMRGIDTRLIASRVESEDRRFLEALGIAAEPAAPASPARELQDLVTQLHGAGKLVVREGRLWFPLAAYEKPLKAYHLKASMGPRARAIAERAVALELDDFALTQAAHSSIPVVTPGYEGQFFVPALEALPACTAFSRMPDADAVQFFDGEQSFAFTVLYPALLLARDPETRLPETLVATAPRAGSGLEDALGRVPADVLRFGLARSTDREASFADLESILHGELAGQWEDWLAGLGARLDQEYGGVVPATGFYTDEQRRFYQRLLERIPKAAEVYEAKSFSLQRAERLLTGLVREAREFGAEEDHWIGVPDRHSERRTSIALGLMAAKTLAMISAPLLPNFASRLAAVLGDASTASRWTEVPDWVPSGSRVDGLAGVSILRTPLTQEAGS